MRNNLKLSEVIDLKLVRDLIAQDKSHRRDIAVMLFPSNKHPENALHNMLGGKTDMTVAQLQSLSLYFNVPLSRFYEPNGWKTEESAPGTYVLTNGDYRAVLDMTAGKTSLTFRGTPVQELVLHSSAIPLNEYLDVLNNLILKHNESKN